MTPKRHFEITWPLVFIDEFKLIAKIVLNNVETKALSQKIDLFSRVWLSISLKLIEWVVAGVAPVRCFALNDAMCCSYFSFPLGIRLLGMNRITLLFVLYLVTVLVCVSSKPFHQSESELKSEIDNHTVEKRSIFGLSAFVLTLLNTILAISLNSSINTQNAEHGGIVG